MDDPFGGCDGRWRLRSRSLAGEEHAACPTCKRPYDDGELDEILASYEHDLEAARLRLAALDRDLAARKESSQQLRKRAEQLRALAADRRAITDAASPTELTALRTQLEADTTAAQQITSDEHRCEARLGELTALLPQLRAQARQLAETLQRVASLKAQREQAEREARIAADDLRAMGENGYDAEAHLRLRTELADAHTAGQRCAELRGKADGLELLQRRLGEQRQVADAAEQRQAELAATLAQVAVDAEALSAAEEASELAEREVDAAHTALLEANRQATTHAEALAAANTRLQDARQQTAELREQRAELRLRGGCPVCRGTSVTAVRV